MRTRKFLSRLIPALPMLLTALLVILVTVIFLTAMRSKAHAQFGGVEQPMFQLTSTGGFVPPSAGIGIWHKPETLPDGSTGDDVALWLDSSGTDHYATNVSTAPKLAANLLDGYNGVTFGPTTAFLNWYSNAGPSVLRNVPGATVFIVFKSTNLVNNSACDLFLFSTPVGTKARLTFEIHSVAQLSRIRSVSADGDTTSTVGGISKSLGDGVWYLLSMTVNYTNSAQTFWTNGVLMGTGTPAWTDGNTSDTDSLTVNLGRGQEGTLLGQIVEFLLYTVPLEAAVRREIETNYFKLKFPSVAIQ